MQMYKVLLCCVVLIASVVCDLPSDPSTSVNAHNNFRAQVSPAASPPLPALTWSSTIASFSSSYANNCVFQHSSGSGYGENLYMTSVTSLGESAIAEAVASWYGEAPNYNIVSNTCTPGQVCGHYTQVVWNTTTQVGCGYRVCPNVSPGMGGPWLIVVCNYSPPGNFNGLRPYAVGSGGGGGGGGGNPPNPPPCNSTCPTGSCGVQTICGATADCGSCPFGQFCNGNSCQSCPNPCGANQCGAWASSTCPNYYFTCPSCPSGQTCSSSNNLCETPPCNTAAACAAIGATCGTQTTSCGQTNCGTCAAGNTCSNGNCVPVPCGGACSSPSQTCDTGSNTCVCASGYSLVNGVCTAGSSGPPTWSSDFTVIGGSGAITTPGSILAVSGSGETFIKYSRTQTYTVIDPAYTKVKVEALATTNQGFGIGFRVGQSGGASDGIYTFLSAIGTANMGLQSKIRQNGAYVYESSILYLPTGFWLTDQANFVQSVLTTNTTTGNTRVCWSQITATGWSASKGLTASISYAPDTGSVGFWFSNPGGSPGIQRLSINTGSGLTISLYNCVDLATWTTMFFQLTGLNPATTSVQTRSVGTNAACKAAGAKEAVSGFVLIVESSTVTASVITQNFAAAVESGSPVAAGLAVKSAAVIPGAEAAEIAGLIPAGVAFDVAAPAAGGAGGGGAGLSGGAIAGIVIGSVGGAILIVGVAAIVVAAVVVAAVVVAKKSSEDDSGPSRSEQPAKRSSIRNTIYNIFRAPRGGVDVMNNPSGHQSITARAPKV